MTRAKPSPVLATFILYARTMNLLLSYAAYVESRGSDGGDEEPAWAREPGWASGVAEEVGRDWPALRWPAFLAAARVAAARGDFETVERYVSGIPPWPEGSPLEAVRRTLQELVERRRHAS